MKKYEFLPHTAEMKFRAFGRTLNEVFENSVLAVSEIISRGAKIKSKKKKILGIEGGNNENFLYNLIDEILYLLDSENFVVSKAKINFNEKVRNMEVIFYGDDAKNYENLDYIKSATYSEMQIKNLGKKNGWEAQVVVDV